MRNLILSEFGSQQSNGGFLKFEVAQCCVFYDTILSEGNVTLKLLKKFSIVKNF